MQGAVHGIALGNYTWIRNKKKGIALARQLVIRKAAAHYLSIRS